MINKNVYGSNFERIFIGLLAIATGIMLVYLSVNGPLLLNQIHYKTATEIANQIKGQDLINFCVLSVLLLISGFALFYKKKVSRYLLIMTPLYLIYYVLSYTIGIEWSSAQYSGNNEEYTFHFLFILIASVLMLLYGLSIFPNNYQCKINKKSKIIYSITFSFFLLLFASMWIKEINEVIANGTSRGYELAPTAFWTIRIFDLGFTIPLGLVSIYLLWTRPNYTYSVQFMFYGFFMTMILAVNCMGLFMYFNNDPTFYL